jgi:hypothetical protein
LIWEKGRYAVIIENKINWAKDQNQQLERYVKAAKGICGQGNVYVIYLTADGRKKVDASSLTPEAKRLLGCTKKSPGRYVEKNYREDVLRWLKDEVLVDCRYGEQSLMSMLKQYIDYLESRFSFTEAKRKNEVCQFLKKKLKQYSPEEREQYTRLNDLLDLCEGERERQEEVGREILNQFINDAWSFRELMLNDNYALDFRAACDVKLWAIQEWAELSGIIKPFKWTNKDGGCAVFQFIKSGCRIKFEIGMYYDKNDMEVCFHNNDYAAKKIGIKKFGTIYHQFRQLFPKNIEEYEGAITSSVEDVNSKKELMALLNGPVMSFLKSDDRWWSHAT